MEFKAISKRTLERLPLYLNYLKSLPKEGSLNISATAVADAIGLNDVQVRKDLALVSQGGRPKVGYITENLILDIEKSLGYSNADRAVIVGAGNLGRSLISYDGFSDCGLNIVAAFDIDDKVIGMTLNGKQVLPASKLMELCRRMGIKTGIITVPASEAQNVCDILTEGGVRAIWNFAPVYLNKPDDVIIKNENMACTLLCFLSTIK
jgi:redox-sensing transcriptional repressor